MSDATATFAYKIDSNAKDVALGDAAALQKLREQIQGDIVVLRQMQQAMRSLQAGGLAKSGEMKELQDRIGAQKAAIAGAQRAYIQLGGSFREGGRGAKAAANGLAALGDIASGLPGPIGALGNKLHSVSALVGRGAMAAGILAIAAALVVLVAASIAAGAALVKYAVTQADARRSELLRLEGLTKVRRFMIDGFGPRRADKASFLQGNIDEVASKVAIGRDQVAQLSDELYRAGLRGGNLQQALEGASIALAGGGQEALTQFKAMAMGIGFMGGNVKKVTDDAKARFGNINKLMMLGLNVQIMKAKENFSALFRGIKIEGFLEGLGKVTEMFSQSTASGRALKVIIETLVQPLINGFGAAGPLAKRFFQGVIIGALLLTLTLLDVRDALVSTFGGNKVLNSLDLQTAVVYAGVVAVGLLAASFVALGVAIGSAVAILTGVVVAVLLPFAALYAGYQLFKKIDWKAAGMSVVQGIADGIRAGFGLVLDAIKSLGIESHKTFKRSILSSSPSRLFFKAGYTAPQGVAGGMLAGKPLVARAAADMMTVPSLPFDQPSLPQIAPVSNSKKVEISIGNLSVEGGADAKSQAFSVRDELMRILEGVGESVAAPEPA
jgi:hypothetical protein